MGVDDDGNIKGINQSIVGQLVKEIVNLSNNPQNLNLRFKQHQNGEVESTKYRKPLKLIYFEACLNQRDALRREKYFKTHYGKMFLKNRLKEWYEQ